MNETIKAHVDQVLDDIRGIYLQAAERIEALRPGEKLPATSLAEDVARGLAMTGPQRYGVLVGSLRAATTKCRTSSPCEPLRWALRAIRVMTAGHFSWA